MTEKKRRNRHQRLDNPKPIHMVPRDIQILKAVYIHRILQQDQLAKLFFGSKERAQKRLVKLYDHAYLDRRFLPIRLGEGGRSPTYYVLDRKGADLLRDSCPELEVTWHHSNKDVTDNYIRHATGINEIMVLIHLACSEMKYDLLTWLTEAQLKADYDYVHIHSDRDKRKRVSVIADTYCEIGSHGKVYPLFVEFDRGTMDGRAIRDKLRGFTAYAKSIGDYPSPFQKRYDRKGFRVLFVTQTEQRKQNLLESVQQVKDNHRFWFAALPHLSPNNILTKPCWQNGGASDLQVLIPQG